MRDDERECMREKLGVSKREKMRESKGEKRREGGKE